jgi:hypothetical protein
MRVQLFAVIATLIFLASTSQARTGPLGFATGFGLGPAGIDFSDGTTRYNIGGTLLTLNGGFHIEDFSLGLEGQFFTIQGTITDFMVDGGFFIKYYFLDNFYLKYKMGLSRLQRTTNFAQTTIISTWTGGSVGGMVGWDVVNSGDFRLSINAGAQRHEFGAIMNRIGEDTSNMDLNNKMVGLMFYTYVGLDWYL